MKTLASLVFSLFILLSLNAQLIDSTYLVEHFDKAEYFIEMRDGKKLYTLVYTPKAEGEFPILLKRTCYNASQSDNYQFGSQPSAELVKEGYIFAFQDVRGRYMSEGLFDNMRPNIKGNDPTNKEDIDESSDTYDTIDWLINNIKNNNGKVGMYGISYPGFYTAAALPDAHPALKASSPQAPIADFFFDDFHHHGAFLQSYTPAFAVFGYQKDTLTRQPWYGDKIMRFYNTKVADGYDFYLEKGPLKTITENYHHDNFFWQQIVEHPNYDDFWQKRSLLPALAGGDIDHAVLTVGGWFDAEDLYGPLNIYKTVEKNNTKAQNSIVMGPWTHGGWARERGQQTVNHIYFGDSISTYYQKEIEAPFFAYHLKGEGDLKLPEAIMFDTGKKEWRKFDEWPPKDIPPANLTFGKNGKLYINKPANPDLEFEYTSDPSKPVPYRSVTEGLTFTPRMFITDDQRDASRRPDVITFATDPLEEDVTIAGEILANLIVSMTSTDADFIVKLIDKYPPDHPNYEHNPQNITMGNYEQLVRHEVFRGRFRDSYSHPKPFDPGVKTEVNVPLQDVLHTFKKGHRIMIQIHSTWFPYIDRNPQKYVDNIYRADEEDFIKSDIIVHGASSIKAGGDAITSKKEIRP
ncbi:MAG: CocE/NonD family hydrolase [Bacteroidota bacterium]